jgi:thiol-disulfide isomerase/thioredoxin
MNICFRICLFCLLQFTLDLGNAPAQNVKLIGIPELEKVLNDNSDRLSVIHLWATWCAPCIKELPNFQKTAAMYDTSNVRFLLVSLDFKSQVEKQLIPFLKKNNISLEVVVITNTDYNSWIDKIDPDWEGTIPATLMFNKKEKIRYFHSGEIPEAELTRLINKYSNS